MALASEFPGATELWDAAVTRFNAKWLLVTLAAVGILLGVAGPAVLAFQAPPANGIDPATLPAGLTDILNVDCE